MARKAKAAGAQTPTAQNGDHSGEPIAADHMRADAASQLDVVRSEDDGGRAVERGDEGG